MYKTNFLVAHPLKHHAFQLGAGCLDSGYTVKCIFPLYFRFGLVFFKYLPSSRLNKLLGYSRPHINSRFIQSNICFKLKRVLANDLTSYVSDFDNYVANKIESGIWISDFFISLQDYMPLSVEAAKKQGMKIWSDQILNNSKFARSNISSLIKLYHPEYIDSFDFSKNEKIIQLADVITSPCDYCDSGISNQVSEGVQVHRVPYGVDEQAFTPKLDYKKHGKIKVLVRAQNLRKGGLQFLESVDSFSNIWPNSEDEIEFLIIGNLDAHVSSALDKLVLPTWVTVKNSVVPNSYMPELMRQSDFFIMPSMSESMSLMCIEAMKIGLPLMITSECGIDRFDDSMGCLVLSDAQSILDGLIYFMKNRESWESWGRSSYRMSQAYSWETYRSDIANVAKKVMNQI